MTNGDFKSLDEYKDIETHRIMALAKKLHFPKWLKNRMLRLSSRDHARTPMQWNEQGGFTKGNPWLKVNENTKVINVSNQENDKSSILSFYRALIKLRKEHQTLINGSFEPIYTKQNIFIYRRKNDNESLITVLSFNRKQVKVKIKINGQVILSNMKERVQHDQIIRPFEAYLIKEE